MMYARQTDILRLAFNGLLIEPRSLLRASPLVSSSQCLVRTSKPVPLPRSRRQWTCRTFSTSQCLLKKKDKKGNSDDGKSAKQTDATPLKEQDPFDLTPLESDLQSIQDRLRSDLSKLRSGGRFNPSALETLRVRPTKESKTTYPLSDLAQVVPRGGRDLHILVSDAAHVKPVSSTISASSFSLTPQPDPTGQNPLMLLVRTPPPTAESRRAVVQEAAKCGEKAAHEIREARGRQQKKFRRAEADKSVRPDDGRKEHAKMEEVVRKAGEEVKKIVDGAKRALDQ